MAAPGANGGGGSGEVDNTLNAAHIESRLLELKELCSVLGINHAGKLKECRIKEGQDITKEANTSLIQAVLALRTIKDSRFQEVHTNSKKLIELWKKSQRAFSKSVDLNLLYALSDASSAVSIKNAKYLSATWLDQVKQEIRRFESEAVTKAKTKYKARKKKLMDLLMLTHLLPIDVRFDSNMLVAEAMYKKEALSIKDKIKTLKPSVLKRKELVFRVEQVRTAIYEGYSTTAIKELLEKASEAADDLRSSSDEVIKYEGDEISIFIGNLWSLACSLSEDLEDSNKNEQDALRRTRTRTRSAIAVQDPAMARKPGCVCNKEINEAESIDDWTLKDRKRICSLAFNVVDLRSTIECYSTCFGMRILREFQHNEKTYAILGYGPDKTTIELIHKNGEDGADDCSNGYGFGHVSLVNDDVKQVAKTIKASRFCNLVNKPCHLRGSSTVIGFASDLNGILFELIQNSKKLEPVSRLLLYAGDIERSIEFYKKALGMSVFKKKEDQAYKTVCLGFEAEDKGTVLELRTSDDAKHLDRGDIYHQVVIETEDVFKSCEILKKVILLVGGQIMEEPNEDLKVCSFLDPNGWRMALVDSSVPDKLMIH